MAHKTLINGTAYEITGGKTLVKGTVYEITGGKTLVNGDVHEISFAEKMATVTVLEHNNATTTGWGVMVNRTKYYMPGHSVSVPVGTTAFIFGYQGIYENGVMVGFCDTPSSSAKYVVNYDIGLRWADDGSVTIEKM